MWRVPINDSYKVYRFTDRFILDVLTWACINRQKHNKEDVLESLADNSLKKLVEKYEDKLIPHLIILSNCVEINKVKRTFKKFRKKYSAIINGDIKKLPTLKEETINSIKPVFRYFYNDLLNNKGFWQIYNQKGIYISKQEYRDKLGQKNKICPYCDRSDIVVKELNNIDHFLPISKFPYLSVFWPNLVIACSSCNGLLIKDNKYNLPVLHPYYHNIQDELNFSYDKENKIIEIKAKTGENYEKGLNYIKTLKLETTYRNLWEQIESEKYNIELKIALSYHQQKLEIKEKDLKNLIINAVNEKQNELLKRARKVPYIKLKTDYCNFYLHDQIEDQEGFYKKELKDISNIKERILN